MGSGDAGGAGFLEASSSDDDSSSDGDCGGDSGGSGGGESGGPGGSGASAAAARVAGTQSDMMRQNSAATQSRMRDLGYREGKLELVDANEFAQVCFERGVRKGARYSAAAGRLRGAIAVLSAFRKTFTDATTFTDALDGVVCDFDALVDPTTVPPELQTACQQLCTRAGLPDEICHGEVGILSLLDVTKDRQ